LSKDRYYRAIFFKSASLKRGAFLCGTGFVTLWKNIMKNILSIILLATVVSCTQADKTKTKDVLDNTADKVSDGADKVVKDLKDLGDTAKVKLDKFGDTVAGRMKRAGDTISAKYKRVKKDVIN
jgi:hypothetical protein